MRSKSTLLMAVCALALAIGAYFLGRADQARAPVPMHVAVAGAEAADAVADAAPIGASPPSDKRGMLPPPNTALKSSYAELQARANGGDKDAASRLLRDLDSCRGLRGSQWNNDGASNELTARSTDGMNAAQLRTYQMQLDAMQLRQQRLRDRQTLCAGVDDKLLDTLLPNLAQAARLGDAQARACYLERGPLYDSRSLVRHPESLQAYRNATSALIDSGLAAGDWRVVDLLQQAYRPGSQNLLAGLIGNDPVQHYRYLKLYRLGAEAHRVDQLDQQLTAAAANLSAAQVAQADDWAQSALRDHFKDASTQTTPQGWDACDF
ncbi:hypothetical protein [Pseudomonas sp. CGJS7]|uniref:hypothetical protein n=1 Tax=Pseudomonas sp. CGJS7 TaxID=3109348 RepID=UPI0030094220